LIVLLEPVLEAVRIRPLIWVSTGTCPSFEIYRSYMSFLFNINFYETSYLGNLSIKLK